jgi:hypothetical protein
MINNITHECNNQGLFTVMAEEEDVEQAATHCDAQPSCAIDGLNQSETLPKSNFTEACFVSVGPGSRGQT